MIVDNCVKLLGNDGNKVSFNIHRELPILILLNIYSTTITENSLDLKLIQNKNIFAI